ncbi:hypothetical protein D3C84_1175700 [compost metagenome]
MTPCVGTNPVPNALSTEATYKASDLASSRPTPISPGMLRPRVCNSQGCKVSLDNSLCSSGPFGGAGCLALSSGIRVR